MSWLTSSYSVSYMQNNYGYDTQQSGEGGCVLYGTQISTSQGHSVPVQNLQVGDKILSYDPVTSKFVRDRVTSINVTHVTSLIDINNAMLYVSGLHDQPIYVKLPNGNTKWIMVGQLNTSDSLIEPITGKWAPVTSIQLVGGNFTVYDISGSYSFYQGGHARSDYIANGALLDEKLPPP